MSQSPQRPDRTGGCSRSMCYARSSGCCRAEGNQDSPMPADKSGSARGAASGSCSTHATRPPPHWMGEASVLPDPTEADSVALAGWIVGHPGEVVWGAGNVDLPFVRSELDLRYRSITQLLSAFCGSATIYDTRTQRRF